MFQKIAVGTAFLAATLAIQPTAAQAQERYYGDADDRIYREGHRYERDRYLEHESNEPTGNTNRANAFATTMSGDTNTVQTDTSVLGPRDRLALPY